MSSKILELIGAIGVAASLCLISSAVSAQQLDGWWVVVGTVPSENSDDDAATHIRESIKKCGFQPFNDFSFKFTGFTNGFTVFVLGAYSSKKEAQTILFEVKKCTPDAYIKQGRYLGE